MSHFYPEIHIERVHEAIRRLKNDFLSEWVPLEAVFAVTPEPVPFAERKSLKYSPIKEGEFWGKTWDCGWFHVKGRVPAEWSGSPVVLKLNLAGELLIYNCDGDPLVGLSSGSIYSPDYNKELFRIFDKCKGGEELEYWLESGSNGLFGVTRPRDPAYVEDPEQIHGYYSSSVVKMRVCRLEDDVWHLCHDLDVVINLVEALPEGSARRMQVLRQCSRALDLLESEGAAATRRALRPIFELPTDPATVDVYGVGHAHIDTAWLWPVRETIRKCGRTFASQINLLERYPEYLFGASQAQLYAFTKSHYPTLYAKIKKAVAAGRWEIQGGMWVEADCNLISGESMVRQLLYGKNFFKQEFGVDVKNLWLPDVFGYSANLPQILSKAGVDYFLTQKLSWNRYNKFPHNTFIWRGIDGSEVLAHFPPTDTYNCEVMPAELRKNEWNNREAGLVQEAISLFGVGNGGGGPKEDHIERGLRLANLNGAPRFHFGFAQTTLEKMSAYADDLGRWQGELYFEYHRGTLTTQAAIKRWNRRAEEALRAAEMVCATATMVEYPAADFDEMWKLVLMNQFHDIIPGSSINRVNVEAVEDLQAVVKRCKELTDKAATGLLSAAEGALTLFNPSTTDYVGMIQLPEGWEGAAGDAITAQQREGSGTVVGVTVPGQTFVTIKREDGAECAAECVAEGPYVLDNGEMRYTFDANLRLISAYDIEASREVIDSKTPANCLGLYHDYPHKYDAWEIDEYYRNMRAGEAVVEGCVKRIEGAARCGLKATLRLGLSVLQQTIWLEAGSKRIDFVTEADWGERHKMLRVAFPTTIVAPQAKFEIQYGYVERATHDNTKWQYGQFEVVGQRWADLSERDYGVALLNDSKYGYRIKEGLLELTLLRAPTEPDPVADLGRHQFTYSLLPHCGDFADSEVLANAAVLNQGLVQSVNRAANGVCVPLRVEGDGLELAVIKASEAGGSLVVRVVELRGLATRGRLILQDSSKRLVETDLLEWSDGAQSEMATLEVDFKPFEIKTWKVV
ncbi:MAG: alpha-mannosidase [Lentisphaerae bacterium]|jgi:alpha-mannosidase|nr:alpha-mannosidase [Lentisphaerota bacterium]